jgi:hypothetical protein
MDSLRLEIRGPLDGADCLESVSRHKPRSAFAENPFEDM